MIKIKIMEHFWDVKILPQEEFDRLYGNDTEGITSFDTREISLSQRYLGSTVITHEIVHAYYYSLCVSSASLQPNQMEEVFCDLFAYHGENILAHSKYVESQLKGTT